LSWPAGEQEGRRPEHDREDGDGDPADDRAPAAPADRPRPEASASPVDASLSAPREDWGVIVTGRSDAYMIGMDARQIS
jgi:hypothetical protein